MKKITKNILGGIILIVLVVLIIFIMFNSNKTASPNAKKETGNNYQEFAKKIKENISKYDEHNYNYQYIENSFVKEGYNAYIDKKGSFYVYYFNSELEEKYGDIKIADNVLAFHKIRTGNDIGNTIYFIYENGNVGSVETEYNLFYEKNNLEINKDLGYKKIVTIINSRYGDEIAGAHGPIFIDIDGNFYY